MTSKEIAVAVAICAAIWLVPPVVIGALLSFIMFEFVGWATISGMLGIWGFILLLMLLSGMFY